MFPILVASTFEVFSARFRELAQVAAVLASSTPMPTISGWIAEMTEGQLNMTNGIIPWPRFLISDTMPAVTATQEYQALKDIVEEDEFLRTRLASDGAAGDCSHDDVMLRRVSTLLSRALLPGIVYERNRVDKVLEVLRKELLRSTFVFCVRAYFRLGGRPLVIAKNLDERTELRPFGFEERLELVNRLRELPHTNVSVDDAVLFETVFETRFEGSLESRFAPVLPRPLLDYQTALRVSVGKVAFALATVELESVFEPGGLRAISPFKRRLLGSVLLGQGNLNDVDTAAVQSVLNHLRTSANVTQTELALRRYNDALGRSRADDALVDYVIGLESILNRDGASEITRRLGQRLACIIGTSGDERVKIGADVAAIYSVRSRVSHGSKTKPTQLKSAVSLAESYLGRLVVKVLEMPAKLDLDSVDETILRGNYRV